MTESNKNFRMGLFARLVFKFLLASTEVCFLKKFSSSKELQLVHQWNSIKVFKRIHLTIA
ncbi:hypothetical protein LEP1GSC051_3240 [Leptospira sp. P2653]|nr:hypothetical protein LEP1GSC051_3240 [Leptospira sp. P2653]